ncbi:hypothetical protein [Ramlibacter sp. AN1133]|uniref:hypothetical protein n=1 Tax=Ramlibacter sp. AN1133 TaxID=3133429 RepID=UPI0030C09AFD
MSLPIGYDCPAVPGGRGLLFGPGAGMSDNACICSVPIYSRRLMTDAIPLVSEVVTLLRQAGPQTPTQLRAHLPDCTLPQIQLALDAATTMQVVSNLGGLIYAFRPRSILELGVPQAPRLTRPVRPTGPPHGMWARYRGVFARARR